MKLMAAALVLGLATPAFAQEQKPTAVPPADAMPIGRLVQAPSGASAQAFVIGWTQHAVDHCYVYGMQGMQIGSTDGTYVNFDWPATFPLMAESCGTGKNFWIYSGDGVTVTGLWIYR